MSRWINVHIPHYCSSCDCNCNEVHILVYMSHRQKQHGELLDGINKPQLAIFCRSHIVTSHHCRSKSDPLVGSHNAVHYTLHILLPIIAHVTTQRKCLSHLCTQHCNLQLTKYAVAPNLLMDGCLSHIAILCAWSPSQPPAAQCSPIQLFCNASSRSTVVHNCSAESGWVLPQHYIHYTYVIYTIYYISLVHNSRAECGWWMGLTSALERGCDSVIGKTYERPAPTDRRN